jgi:hypothetical protein
MFDLTRSFWALVRHTDICGKNVVTLFAPAYQCSLWTRFTATRHLTLRSHKRQQVFDEMSLLASQGLCSMKINLIGVFCGLLPTLHEPSVPRSVRWRMVLVNKSKKWMRSCPIIRYQGSAEETPETCYNCGSGAEYLIRVATSEKRNGLCRGTQRGAGNVTLVADVCLPCFFFRWTKRRGTTGATNAIRIMRQLGQVRFIKTTSLLSISILLCFHLSFTTKSYQYFLILCMHFLWSINPE